MTDDLGTGELSSPATNGATGYSVSALSVGSNGGTKAIDASDVEARSTVTFLIAEINRLAEEISVRSSFSKAIDASDVLLDRKSWRTLSRHYDRLGHGGVMSKFERLLEPGSTELPDCRCAAEMNLMAMVPVPGGDTEIRIFRCPDCSHELRLTTWRPC